MSDISDQELGEIYAFAVQLGKDAGKMLMDAARSRFSEGESREQAYTEKDNAVDLVTKTDEGITPFCLLTCSPDRAKANT